MGTDIPSAEVIILRLTTVHEDRVILSEAKNLDLLRIGPTSKDQGEILRFAQNDSAFSWQRGISFWSTRPGTTSRAPFLASLGMTVAGGLR